MMIGDCDEVDHLKEITIDSYLQKHIIFTCQGNHDQILDYYSVGDVFLYPRFDAKVNHKVTPPKPYFTIWFGKLIPCLR